MQQTKSKPNNLYKAKIRDFGRVVTGKTPPTKNQEYYGDKYPFITPTDISDSSIFVNTPARYLSEEGAKRVASSKLPAGSVCYTCIASVGKIAITKEESFTNQQINSIIVDPKKADYRYPFYLLKNITLEIKGMVGGAASPIINKSAFENIDVDILNPQAQQSVADILFAYDLLIENNTKRIKNLEEIAQAIYREWFVYFRFPRLRQGYGGQAGYEKARTIDSKTEFGKIPEGWAVKNLGDKIDIFRGKNITKNTIVVGKIPVVAGGLGPAYFHNKANAEGPVITVSASGANAGYVNLYYEDIWASDCSYINKSSTPFVYYYYLLLKERQVEVTGLQRGSAQPHVYPKDLARLSIVDVPEKLINAFEEKANSLFSVINNLQMRNQKLRQARDLLLPKLVTGEIEVKT